MKITIIIPIYNVAPYISDCLHSVMNQTYQGEIECLLVDDCGSDNSMEVVNEELMNYNGNIDFHVYHHQHNRGLSAARNTGLKYATGEYVYFLDSDDEITSNCISLLSESLDKRSYDFVIGGYRTIGAKQSAPPLLLNDNTILSGDDINHSYYKGKWYMMVCGKLCNTSFLRENHLFFEEGLLHEDELWSFQLACLAKSMLVVNKETYIYKIREGSITMNQKTQERRAIAFQQIIRKMTDFVLYKHIKNEYAYLKIFSMLSVLDAKLPQWSNIRSREQNEIIKNLRKQLSRISYYKRLLCCMTNVKYMVQYGAILLPIFMYRDYNKAVSFILKISRI